MASLFKTPKIPDPPPPPKPKRMPTQEDPDVIAAGKRTRADAMRRKGRMSTILTDRTKETTGSSGQKLGV
ncbi:MAG: hypothetical protein ACOC9Q_00770 [bacterium]